MKDKLVLRVFIILVGCGFLSLSMDYRAYTDGPLIWADGQSYYLYLPSFFIYDHDKDIPTTFNTDDRTGKIHLKTTYGVSLLEAPFFLMAHGVAHLTSYPEDGYSWIYEFGIMVSAVFYMTLGLYFLSRLLEKKGYQAKTIILSLLGILGGTNLYYYTIGEPDYSHVFSFFLISAFFYTFMKYIERPVFKVALLVSLIYGLLVLVRPVNAIVGLFIFFDTKDLKGILSRLELLFKKWYHFLGSLPFVFLLYLPQFLYWKSISGKYIFYSYGDQGFIFWNNPKIFQVLFDVRNGLFIYSPLLLFAMVGIFMLIRRKELNGWLYLLIFLLATYIFSSWWAYWFGGAFGHRSFVDYYPLLIFPLAYTVSSILKMNTYFKSLALLVYGFLIFYSVRLAYLYEHPWEGPDWGWDAFFGVLKNLI